MKKAKPSGDAKPNEYDFAKRLSDLESEQKRNRTDIDELERRISELEEALSNVGRGAESPRARSTDDED